MTYHFWQINSKCCLDLPLLTKDLFSLSTVDIIEIQRFFTQNYIKNRLAKCYTYRLLLPVEKKIMSGIDYCARQTTQHVFLSPSSLTPHIWKKKNLDIISRRRQVKLEAEKFHDLFRYFMLHIFHLQHWHVPLDVILHI